MRKNLKRVVAAFERGTAHAEGSVSTNGKEVFSYAMKIADRTPAGVRVIAISESPSKTTSQAIAALHREYPKAQTVTTFPDVAP